MSPCFPRAKGSSSTTTGRASPNWWLSWNPSPLRGWCWRPPAAWRRPWPPLWNWPPFRWPSSIPARPATSPGPPESWPRPTPSTPWYWPASPRRYSPRPGLWPTPRPGSCAPWWSAAANWWRCSPPSATGAGRPQPASAPCWTSTSSGWSLAIRHRWRPGPPGSTPIWRVRQDLLRSVPGVGPVLCANLIASLPELGSLSRERIAALVGVAPLNRDSGAFGADGRLRPGRPVHGHLGGHAPQPANQGLLPTAVRRRQAQKGGPNSVYATADHPQRHAQTPSRHPAP